MSKITSLQDIFQTSDLALAAYLSQHFPLNTVDKTDKQRVNFIFQRVPELDGYVEAYWRDEALTSPIQYFNQLKWLKTRIYEG